MRVLFPTQLQSNEVSVNGHFGVFNRSLKEIDGEGWVRPPQTTFPFHKWFGIWDEKQAQGLAVFSRGLPEYEAYYGENKQKVGLALTLFRSTRRWGSHINVSNPPVFTPRAQLYGKEMTFEYAIVPLNKKWNDFQEEEEKPLHIRAEEYYTPLKYEENYDTFRYEYRLGNKDRNLAPNQGLLEISPANIVYSSFKGSEDWIQGKKQYILRVYNILNKDSKAKVVFQKPVNGIEFLDLKEDKQKYPPDYSFNEEEGFLEFSIRANQIQTIGLKFR